MLRTISAVLLLLSLAQSAEACRHWRCRRLSTCRYQKVVVQKQIVPVAVPQQVVNISNVYPSGNTQYTLAQAAAVYGANPDLLGASAARIADNAVSGFSSVALAALAGNVDVARVASLQAATAHLRTAIGVSDPSSVTLKITQSGGGGIDVQRVAEATAAELNQGAAAESVISAKCAKCHGTSLASPKGDLFIDAGHELDPLTIVKSLDAIRKGTMPPEGSPALAPEEKAGIMEELLGLLRDDSQAPLPPAP